MADSLYFKSFEVDSPNAGTRWIEYVNAFERFCCFQGISVDERKMNGLLHVAGEAVAQIYSTLEKNTPIEGSATNGATKVEANATTNTPEYYLPIEVVDKYADVVKKLTTYFNPKRSKVYSRNIFRSLKQLQDESVITYVTRLRSAAQHCEFQNIDDEILDTLLLNCYSDKLTRKALSQTEEPNLKTVLLWAQNEEIAAAQSKAMREPNLDTLGTVNQVGRLKAPRNSSQRSSPKTSISQNKFSPKPNSPCSNCGLEHGGKGREKCPAKDDLCNKCKKKGHWAKKCRQKLPVDCVDNEDYSSEDDHAFGITQRGSQEEYLNDEFCFSIHQRDDEVEHSSKDNFNFNATLSDSSFAISDSESCYGVDNPTPSRISKAPRVVLKLLGKDVLFIIDTGSSLNIIDKKTFESLPKQPNLSPGVTNAYRFHSNSPIVFLGQFSAKLHSRINSAAANIHVLSCSSKSPNLLSFNMASELGLINFVQQVSQDTIREQMKARYPSLFSGKIGCLKGVELELSEDKTVRPVKMFHYRIPYNVQPQVTELLNQYENDGLIEKADGPTTWISASHIVPKKDGSVRLVDNAKPVNKAIIRNRHISPTLDDIAVQMNGSTIFSKVDLKDAYKQILLSPKSRHLTVFSTHLGLFRDKRLSQGLNAAAENFQRIIGDQIQHLKKCINVSDDIIVHGKNPTEHDDSLHKLLSHLEKVGLTANLKKCEFGVDNIDFFGVNFSSRGIAPSISRVAAFQQASSPTSVSEVRSLLAVANYSARFIHNFAKLIAPLRELANESTSFDWKPEHEMILSELKKRFTATSLAYYNPTWNTEVICDASPVGLGAILVQSDPDDSNERRIIAFASRTLSNLEKKYAQVELEALALVFGVEKFHQYIYGKRFKLFTDAKAIAFIYGNCERSQKSSARIERWGLRLLPYDFEIMHTPGDGNPADYLSRHPIDDIIKEKSTDVDLYVNFIINSSIPKKVTREQIAKATREDADMQTLTRAIELNDRNIINNHGVLKEFNNVFNELTISNDGIILRLHQIVIPHSLRQTMIDIAHEGHLGIVKTKRLMRVKVWFPHLDSMVERKITGCIACQACTPSNSSNMVPSTSPPVPETVWENVGGDFFGPLPSGHYLLCLVCKLSGYPVVEVITSTGGKAVIQKIDRIFSEFGIPKIFGSDNGPPFQSRIFNEYCSFMGVFHKKSTPLWPRGNSICERLMQSLGKVVKIAQLEGKPWRSSLNAFLRSYRASPHSTTGIAPNQLMFNRNDSSRLPSAEYEHKAKGRNLAEEFFLHYARTNKEKHADKNRALTNQKLCTKPSAIKSGDNVLLRQKRINKLSAHYGIEKFTVVARQGSWVLCKNSKGKEIARNISFCKKLPADPLENPRETQEESPNVSEHGEPASQSLNDLESNDNSSEVAFPEILSETSEHGDELSDPGENTSKHSSKKKSIEKKKEHRSSRKKSVRIASKESVDYRQTRPYKRQLFPEPQVQL